MKKKIIALALCLVMLTSMTSCGLFKVNVGGLSSGIIEDAISSLTTVVSSEHYSINLGMMAYYYNAKLQSFTAHSYIPIDGEISSDIVIKEFKADNSTTIDKETVANKDYELKYESDLDASASRPKGENYFTVDKEAVANKDFAVKYEAELGAIEWSPSPEAIIDAILNEAKDILIYCEIADIHGIYLTDEDYRAIDEELIRYVEKSAEEATTAEAASNSLIKNILGSVLTSDADARKAIEYSHLANKAKDWLRENTEAGVSSWDIEERYGKQEHDGEDEENVRELYYIFTQNEMCAREIVISLQAYGNVDSDAFIEVSNRFDDADVKYVDDYTEGDMNSDAFDEWLYSANVGEITEEPVYDKRYDGYFVAYYEREGDPVWYVKAKEEITNERFQDSVQQFKNNISVSENGMMMDMLTYLLEG